MSTATRQPNYRSQTVTAWFDRIRKKVVMPSTENGVVIISLKSPVTRTLTQLPFDLADRIWNQVVDVALLKRLTKTLTINWLRTVRPMFPLSPMLPVDRKELTASRESLITAITATIWGVTSPEVVTFVRRLVYVALTQPETIAAARYSERAADVISSESRQNSVGLMTSSHDRSLNHTEWSTAFDDDDVGSSVIQPIHIFVLSNVLRRPIIVLQLHNSEDDQYQQSSLWNNLDDNSSSLSGIYLPVLHQPGDCCRSPIAVVQLGSIFAALVPRAVDSGNSRGTLEKTAEYGVPLWCRETNEPLIVRCLLPDRESPEQALSVFLRVVDLPYTTATSSNLVPVARYDVIAPEINLIDELGDSHPTISSTYGETFVTPLELLSQPVVAFQPSTTAAETKRCQTPGCEFFGRQEHGWKCSHCYSNVTAPSRDQSSATSFTHVTTAAVSLVPSGGHLESLWPGSLVQTGSCTSLASSVNAIICSEPACSRPVRISGEVYCGEHAITLGLTSLGFRQQPNTECSNRGCPAVGLDKYGGLCSKCFVISTATGSDVKTATKATVESERKCLMDFCDNIGLSDYKGLCIECFRILTKTRLGPNSLPQCLSGRSVENSEIIRCMMEGCRNLVNQTLDVCVECKFKQQQAYDELVKEQH